MESEIEKCVECWTVESIWSISHSPTEWENSDYIDSYERWIAFTFYAGVELVQAQNRQATGLQHITICSNQGFGDEADLEIGNWELGVVESHDEADRPLDWLIINH